MSASDNLNPRQFMGVDELLRTHSAEAMSRLHDGDARVSSLYDLKAPDLVEHRDAFKEIDEPIRDGSIDPVLLERGSGGNIAVSEGHHRIIRAHQLGVPRLPVSYNPGSQKHSDHWDDVAYGW